MNSLPFPISEVNGGEHDDGNCNRNDSNRRVTLLIPTDGERYLNRQAQQAKASLSRGHVNPTIFPRITLDVISVRHKEHSPPAVR